MMEILVAIDFIASTVWLTAWPPSRASRAALVAMPSVTLALSAFCLTLAAISCSEAVVSSTLAACSLADWLSVCEVADTWPEAAVSAAAAAFTSEMVDTSWRIIALVSVCSWAKMPWWWPSSVPVRSPWAMRLIAWLTSPSDDSVDASSLFRCSPSVRKKPSRCARFMRRVKSPCDAASTTWVTSSSADTSAVRSTHSRIEPTRWPCGSLIGLATSLIVCTPNRNCAACGLVIWSTMPRWCDGLRWKVSKFWPTTLSAEKCGTALRRSASMRRSSCSTERLAKRITPALSVTITALGTASSARRMRRFSCAARALSRSTPRTVSIVSLMKAFLPGSFCIGAS